jgi:hypothetical protein
MQRPGAQPTAPQPSLESRIERTLSALARTFAAFDDAAHVLGEAAEGRHASHIPEALAIATRCRQDAIFRQRLARLAAQHAHGARSVAQARNALEAALRRPDVTERRQRLYAIPLALLQESGRQLIGAPGEWADEPEVHALLARAHAAAMRAEAAASGRSAPESGHAARTEPIGTSPGQARPGSAPSRSPGAARPTREAAGRTAGLLDAIFGWTRALADESQTDEALKALAATEGAVAQVRSLYMATASRMRPIEWALALRDARSTGASPPDDPAERAAAILVARSMAEKADLHRRCQVAVAQVLDVRRELYLVEVALQQARSLPPSQAGQAAQDIDLARLKGLAIPLANFWRTFAGDPILEALFPKAV